MANPEHLAILKQGVERWNEWRRGHLSTTPELESADLQRVDLNAADLRSAQLCEARCRMAQMIGTQLSGANCRGADLAGAFLLDANLRGADLTDADLREANLSGTHFRGATLAGAKFGRARTLATVFDDVDLSSAHGLELIIHFGPSTVGVDTLYKSRGKIPEVFLRGCGVPEGLIAYIGSMVGHPIEYYSCFISYSTKDQAFADRLYADLQAKGVRCWFAPHEMKAGRKIHEQIDEAIRVHDKLLLILSEHSMTSEWVKTELGKALKREKHDGKRALFPVRLVSFEAMERWEYIESSGRDLAEEVREYFIPDFSQWDKDNHAYQTAMQKLISDLKAE